MKIDTTLVNQPAATYQPSQNAAAYQPSDSQADSSKPTPIQNASKVQGNIGNLLPNSIELMKMEKSDPQNLPVAEKVVVDAIERANRAVQGANTSFEFSIHEKTKQIMIKVINKDTKEVIREIPPEKTLDMVAKFWEMAGILVDERR